MLPAQNRVRHTSEFSSVVRSGRRLGGRTVVLHHVPVGPGADARVGFVVSKAVGGSVARNLVSRRLRAQMSSRLDRLPAGSVTVVRALPASATADSHDLGRDLDRALDRLAGRR